MATNGLGCLIMTAVIDQSFRERLLAAPSDVMTEFELTDDEQRALTSIRAGSFTEFAAQLYRWLEQRDPFPTGTRKDDGLHRFEKRPDEDVAVDTSSATSQAQGVRRRSHSRPLHSEFSRVVRTHRHAESETDGEEARIAVPVRVPELG